MVFTVPFVRAQNPTLLDSVLKVFPQVPDDRFSLLVSFTQHTVNGGFPLGLSLPLSSDHLETVTDRALVDDQLFGWT